MVMMFFNNCIVPLGFLPWGTQVTFLRSMLGVLVFSESTKLLMWTTRSLMCINDRMYIHMVPQFKISFKGLLWGIESAQNFDFRETHSQSGHND